MAIECFRLHLQVFEFFGIAYTATVERLLVAIYLGFLGGDFLLRSVGLGTSCHQLGLGLLDISLGLADAFRFGQDGADVFLPQVDLVQAQVDFLQRVQAAGSAHVQIIEADRLRRQPYIWRNWRARSTITFVKSRTEWILVCFVSAGVALLTLVPYLIAARLVPQGTVFSGFLLNPVDGYSYLAKMRQGMDGAWSFTLPYTGVAGARASVFIFYLALGHLAGWLGAPLLGVYQAARVVGGFAMYMAAYWFLEAILSDRRARWIAFSFVLLGSGLGWMAAVFGLQTSDLLVPESIPFVTGFTNAHFPMALAMVAVGARLVYGEGRWALRAAAGVVVGLVLGVVLPFAAGPLLGMGLAWSIWETRRTENGDKAGWIRLRGWLPTLAMGLGALPWLAYDLWLVSSSPMFAAWNAQNQTPSPPVWDYAIGFGPILVWAIYAVWRGRALNSGSGRLLLAWAIVNSLLLYVPINLQRRFSLGLFLPLAALAGMGIARLIQIHGRRAWLVFALTILMCLPSNALVVGAGLSLVASGSQVVTETTGETRAYAWLTEHASRGSVVLASPETGARLPAYAPVLVVAGHPFETPHSQSRIEQLAAIFGGTLSPEATAKLIEGWGVAYVFYGPREGELGPVPAWLSEWSPIFQAGNVTIYATRAS
jgi:hypothetical protein